MYLYQLAKARGVVVPQGLCVTEGLQQRIGLQHLVLHAGSTCAVTGLSKPLGSSSPHTRTTHVTMLPLEGA